ncbi:MULTISPECIES: glycine zipper family protein [unclassified Nitrosomonas]|uniref:glycine zipper family protein n=1 Tax=unclassified Nitrosomonas TaxID=2609265 RepID=UPI00089CBE27|nr:MULTISPECIES: glycine zipper family protein [unclassified Nitrosomonas]MDV6343518.1 glycine zipper family protein [Nitrosomonas sp. Is37]SDY48356.1 Glycine-zipper containing OmpA-like membrane domain-containing protein [Nitrosomonas sp. Nm33]
MNKTTMRVALIASLLISACASQTRWTPTVDTYNNPNASRLNQDLYECDQLAREASGGTAKETAVGAGVGAALGAAGGAVVGAFTGNPGKGAAIGAAAGGLGGAAKQGFGAEESFKSAYRNCLRNRGHRVVN